MLRIATQCTRKRSRCCRPTRYPTPLRRPVIFILVLFVQPREPRRSPRGEASQRLVGGLQFPNIPLSSSIRNSPERILTAFGAGGTSRRRPTMTSMELRMKLSERLRLVSIRSRAGSLALRGGSNPNQLGTRHGEKVFVTAKRNSVKRCDHDSIFTGIFVL